MDLVIHEGEMVSGYLTEGQEATTEVAAEQRRDTMKNHTATHLLHEALRRVLGLHVRQAGSLVDPEKLRFDFNHFAPLTTAEMTEVEDQVNACILENIPVTTEVLPQKQALASGAIAFFGEKYGETVRVIAVGDYSKEFCGGTHVAATGEIGCLKIISERGLASGVRRLVALTGKGALARFREAERLLDEAKERFFLNRETFVDQLLRDREERRALEQKIDELKLRLAKGGVAAERIEEVAGFKVIVKQVSEVGGGQLRQLADELLGRIVQGVVLLGSDMEGKVQLIVKTNRSEIHAGQLVGRMAAVVGGKGGGGPDMAMAGGKDSARLGEALEAGLAQIQAAF
jgi:alanyl-tRNA synthetase